MAEACSERQPRMINRTREDARSTTQDSGENRGARQRAPARSDDEEEEWTRVTRQRTGENERQSGSAARSNEQQPPTNDESLVTGKLGGFPSTGNSDTEEGRPMSQRRGKRAAHEHARGYDETKRRKTRRKPPVNGYVEKGNQARAGGLKRAMQIGSTTVERVVRGRYEWRDGGLQPMTGDRRTIWNE